MTDDAKLLDTVDEHFEEIVCGDKVEPMITLTLEEAKELDGAMTYLYMNTDVGKEYANIINKLCWKIQEAENIVRIGGVK